MTKLTFRADGDLVDRLEALDASKSEVMRDALREYLDGREPGHDDTIDGLIAERVDALIEDRLSGGAHDVDLTITVESPESVSAQGAASDVADRVVDDNVTLNADRGRSCPQCGTTVDADHEYCPNCGGTQSGRPRCQCGEELSTDWAFCPSCGDRTPAADVLDRS